MDILYLPIPLSAALILCILGVFAWALHSGQFEELEREAGRIFADDAPGLDPDQARGGEGTEESVASQKPT